MIRREASRNILSMAGVHPVLTVAGPRHAGKTTLVRRLFARHDYVNLDNPAVRERARADPAGFLGRYPGDLIIDEYSRAPELHGHIRAAVSAARRAGRFILVTSRLPARGYAAELPFVRRAATQILLPLSISELCRAKILLERDEYIYRGFMPRLYGEKSEAPGLVYLNYLTYFIDRDAPTLMNIDTANPDTRAALSRLIRRLAERAGQIINTGLLAEETGVPVKTLEAWIAALEANFIIFKLPSLAGRFEKRAVKVPKIYFVDVGMAAYLLKIRDPEQVFREPMAGNLFENMAVAEAFKCLYNSGSGADLYYYRDTDNLEIDLLVDRKKHVVPIEIKSGSEPNSAYARNIASFKALAENVAPGRVVYSGETREKPGRAKFVNFREIGGIVRD